MLQELKIKLPQMAEAIEPKVTMATLMKVAKHLQMKSVYDISQAMAECFTYEKNEDGSDKVNEKGEPMAQLSNQVKYFELISGQLLGVLKSNGIECTIEQCENHFETIEDMLQFSIWFQNKIAALLTISSAETKNVTAENPGQS